MDVSELIQSLSAESVDERRSAAERLAQAGPETRGAAVPLVRAGGDPDDEVREWASSALEEMGACDKEDASSLTSLLEDPNADVGYWAATLLGRLEADAAAAVPALARVVEHANANSVRQRAVWALGMIGPAAKSAENVLSAAA